MNECTNEGRKLGMIGKKNEEGRKEERKE